MPRPRGAMAIAAACSWRTGSRTMTSRNTNRRPRLRSGMTMARVEYRGVGGILLSAESYGTDDDPGVLLIHSGAAAREGWRTAAIALAEAGRHVISLDLRGQGDSPVPADGRYDLDAQMG